MYIDIDIITLIVVVLCCMLGVMSAILAVTIINYEDNRHYRMAKMIKKIKEDIKK